MRGGAPGGSDGLALVFVLMVVLAVTGLATVGLNLALAEARLAAAVRHRVASDLLAEGAAAFAMSVTPSPAPDSSAGPSDAHPTWRSGESAAAVAWLSPEVALVRAWGRARGAPSERWTGTLGWALDPAAHFGAGTALAAGGGIDLPPGFAPVVDTCGSSPPIHPGPGPLPARWTSPLDLALGWRGGRVPSASELESLRRLSSEGALRLLGDRVSAGPDSAGPVLAVAPGDLTLAPDARLSGLLVVAGDLRIAPSAGFAGVLRVLGTITVDAGADVVLSGCVAERGLERTGWGRGLHPIHGFVGLIPL
jgi:hypothetical protein